MTVQAPLGTDFLTPAPTRPGSRVASDATPWLASLFCLLLMAIPSIVRAPVFPAVIATPARLAGFFMMLIPVWSFFFPRQDRRSEDVRVNPGVLIVVFYLAVVTILWSAGLLMPGTAAQTLAKKSAITSTVLAAGIAFYAIQQLGSRHRRSVVLGSLLIGIAYSSFIGILQNTASLNFATFLTPPFYQAVGSSQLFARLGSIRASGTTEHALTFGALCASAIPIALHFLRYSTTGSRRVLAGIATLLLAVAIPMSIARSSLIAVGAAMAFYILGISLRRLANVLILSAAAYAAFGLIRGDVFQALWDTITNSAKDPSVLARVKQIDKVIGIYQENPVKGVGLGAITVVDFGPIDNYWAVALAETGLIGAFAFAALCLGGLFGIAAAVRRTTTPQDRDQMFAVGAMFIGLISVTPLFGALNYDSIYFLFFLLFGILWSGYSYSVPRLPPRSRDSGRHVEVLKADR